MGRIKSTLIKRTARVLEKDEVFSEEFNRNKRLLRGALPSKSMRNKIAGYISRLRRVRNKEKVNIDSTEISGTIKNDFGV